MNKSANVAKFWAATAEMPDGSILWWQQGTRSRPEWSSKLTPHCFYTSKNACRKLVEGKGSTWFTVPSGAKVAMVELTVGAEETL